MVEPRSQRIKRDAPISPQAFVLANSVSQSVPLSSASALSSIRPCYTTHLDKHFSDNVLMQTGNCGPAFMFFPATTCRHHHFSSPLSHPLRKCLLRQAKTTCSCSAKEPGVYLFISSSRENVLFSCYFSLPFPRSLPRLAFSAGIRAIQHPSPSVTTDS